MEDLFCNVCVNEFNATNAIPKSLECGHSICSSCIVKILDTTKYCPICKQSLRKKTSSDFPTNYPQLNLLKRFKSVSFDTHIEEKFGQLRNSFLECIETVSSKSTTLMELIQADLSQIDDVIEAGVETLTLIDAQKLLVKLKGDLRNVEQTFSCNSESASCSDFPNEQISIASFRLSEFEDGQKFLQEVLLQLNNGKTMYSAKLIDGQYKYGKVSTNDNIILVHALSFFYPKDRAQPTIISFDDLTRCSGVKSCRLLAFIEYPIANGERMKIFFKLMNSFPSFQFIELCTGERGARYKGVKFVKGSDKAHKCTTGIEANGYCANSLITTNYYTLNGVVTNGPLHYELSLCPKVEENKYFQYQKIVELFPNGGFQVFQIAHTDNYRFSNVVGVGVNKHTHTPLFNEEATILDSGIAYQLC